MKSELRKGQSPGGSSAAPTLTQLPQATTLAPHTGPGNSRPVPETGALSGLAPGAGPLEDSAPDVAIIPGGVPIVTPVSAPQLAQRDTFAGPDLNGSTPGLAPGEHADRVHAYTGGHEQR